MTTQKTSAWLAVVLSVIGVPLKVLRVARESEGDPAFEHATITSNSVFLVANVLGLALALIEPRRANLAGAERLSNTA